VSFVRLLDTDLQSNFVVWVIGHSQALGPQMTCVSGECWRCEFQRHRM
jgi:hypothetical protein